MEQRVIKGQKISKLCHFCGNALYDHEVAAYFWGEYVDYNLREKGLMSVWLCHGCWEKVSQFSSENDIDRAIRRRRQGVGF